MSTADYPAEEFAEAPEDVQRSAGALRRRERWRSLMGFIVLTVLMGGAGVAVYADEVMGSKSLMGLSCMSTVLVEITVMMGFFLGPMSGAREHRERVNAWRQERDGARTEDGETHSVALIAERIVKMTDDPEIRAAVAEAREKASVLAAKHTGPTEWVGLRRIHRAILPLWGAVRSDILGETKGAAAPVIEALRAEVAAAEPDAELAANDRWANQAAWNLGSFPQFHGQIPLPPKDLVTTHSGFEWPKLRVQVDGGHLTFSQVLLGETRVPLADVLDARPHFGKDRRKKGGVFNNSFKWLYDGCVMLNVRGKKGRSHTAVLHFDRDEPETACHVQWVAMQIRALAERARAQQGTAEDVPEALRGLQQAASQTSPKAGASQADESSQAGRPSPSDKQSS